MFYCFNGLTLDVARGCLRAGTHDIGLRPKSFEVLRYLVENAGRLIAKEELFAAVWPHAVVTDESLARCISDVRAAIGDRDQTIIKTAPRRGYLFSTDATHHNGLSAQSDHTIAISGPRHSRHERPTVAVLAFTNMSGDPAQEYFSDGITEDIVTELSRFSELGVIARNSSFRYKGKPTDVRRIGRELNARYVLQGSIQRADRRIRISAQLVDAATGEHRWAERYDRALDDVLKVQDEIAGTVAAILAAHVSNAEADRILRKPPATWEAYDYYMRAAATLNSLMSSFQMADLLEARRLAEHSLSIDPGYARPYAILASTYLVAWGSFHSSSIDPAVLDKAYDLASTAVQCDGRAPQVRAQFGITLSWKRHHEAALVEFGKAVALNPNFSDWRHALALLLASQPTRALEVGRSYVRLDPFAPASASVWVGASHYMLKEYAQALPHLREAASRMPNTRFPRTWLAATYAQLGELELARAVAAEGLRLDPGYTIERNTRIVFGFKSPEDTQHFCDGLRKAGVPER